MRLFGRTFGRTETRASAEDPTVPVSAENFMAFFGIQAGNLPTVTIDKALTVPAFLAGVSFLSGTLANIPLHAYKTDAKGAPERIKGGIQRVTNEAFNEEWSSFAARKYFWQQVFTGGRGLLWIERAGNRVVGLWPMDPARSTVAREGLKKVYRFDGKTYQANEVIDVPFLLKANQVASYGPVVLGKPALQLALAMGDYAAGFFAGGGVPPLALTGPLPAGAEAIKRAQGDIKRAIDAAKSKGEPVFPIPAGYDLKPVGFDPAKGQMTEARKFQVVELARVLNLPPVFLQDLTSGTFNNVEQQDLHLVKHLVAQWCKALEDEMNLKLFGARPNGQYVEHKLDALMRGDFKSRIEALARGIQTAQLMPDEARALENRGPAEHGNKLYIQGATVPLGSQPLLPAASSAGPDTNKIGEDA